MTGSRSGTGRRETAPGRGLIAQLGRTEPALAAEAEELLDDLLDTDGAHGARYRSTLNSDGSPVQLCRSLRGDESAWVLIVDPASDVADPVARCAIDRAALHDLVRVRLRATETAELDRLVSAALPNRFEEIPEMRAGSMWIAAPLGGAGGLGVYLNAGWGGRAARWDRVQNWLTDAGVSPSASRAPIAALRGRAHPSSLGVDVTATGEFRFKVYFRLDEPTPLRHLGSVLWRDPVLSSFAATVIADRAVSTSGLVLCLGFDRVHDEPIDVKLDVCGHCLEGTSWHRVLPVVAEAVGTGRTDGAAIDDAVGVAFVGVGISSRGAPRWNLYLRDAA